jgi:hypothetical protein
MDVMTRTKTKLSAGVYQFLVTGRDTCDFREMSALDPSQYGARLCEFYERRMGKPLYRKKLRSFNEKIQWLKLWDFSAEKGVLADKYQARPWVAEQIGTELPAPLLRVWDDPDQIDFELPSRFVLKATRAGGWKIVVSDEATLNVAKACTKMRRPADVGFAVTKPTMALRYRYYERRVSAEKLLDFGERGPVDYRFFCSWGNVFWVWEDTASRTLQYPRNTYTPDWEPVPAAVTWRSLGKSERPGHYDDMFGNARKLSRDLSFVRAEFCEHGGEVLFGEMTFTPMLGYVVFELKSFDIEREGGYLSAADEYYSRRVAWRRVRMGARGRAFAAQGRRQ